MFSSSPAMTKAVSIDGLKLLTTAAICVSMARARRCGVSSRASCAGGHAALVCSNY
jgi:hypothetical protein